MLCFNIKIIRINATYIIASCFLPLTILAPVHPVHWRNIFYALYFYSLYRGYALSYVLFVPLIRLSGPFGIKETGVGSKSTQVYLEDAVLHSFSGAQQQYQHEDSQNTPNKSAHSSILFRVMVTHISANGQYQTYYLNLIC